MYGRLTGSINPPSVMQESELALQRLAGGLRELTGVKTDLSQYVAAGDSALLEQQLEQLHGQWEELCNKVSAAVVGETRRQGSRELEQKSRSRGGSEAGREGKVASSGALAVTSRTKPATHTRMHRRRTREVTSTFTLTSIPELAPETTEQQF